MNIFGLEITRSGKSVNKTADLVVDTDVEESTNIQEEDQYKEEDAPKGIISPGRVSVPNDVTNIIQAISGSTSMVTPSFRSEIIPLIRNLYKVNSDMSITVQDTFKLANTGHNIKFPYNKDVEECNRMEEHLKNATTRWSNYTSGINGLVNKFIVQCLIGGAISIEGVPNNKLDSLSTVLFINPEDVMFKRENDGVYKPYQINKTI